MNIFYAPEMTGHDFKSIFTQYTKDIMEEVQDQKYHRLLNHFEKLYARFIFRNKASLQVISHIFGCNFGLKIAFQFFNSLRLWDWEEDIAPQKLIDIWFYNIKRTYGNQFPQLNKLPDQFLLDVGTENNLDIDNMSLSEGSSKSNSENGTGSDGESEGESDSNAPSEKSKASKPKKTKKQKTQLFNDPRRDDRMNENLKRRASRHAVLSITGIDDDNQTATLSRKSLINILDFDSAAASQSNQNVIREEGNENAQRSLPKEGDSSTRNKTLPLIVIKGTSDIKADPIPQEAIKNEENTTQASPFSFQEEETKKVVAVSELDAESPGNQERANPENNNIVLTINPEQVENDVIISPPKINLGLVPQVDSAPGSQNNSKENSPKDVSENTSPESKILDAPSLEDSPEQSFKRRTTRSKTSLNAQTGNNMNFYN